MSSQRVHTLTALTIVNPAAMLALAGWAALSACSSLPTTPHDLLDENTGSTITVVAQPLLFVRVRTDASASAHDWVSLVAVERDNAGRYSQFLLLYRWSTVDQGKLPRFKSRAGRLLIQADGRQIELAPLEGLPGDLSRRHELFAPDHADAVVQGYPVDLEAMRRIATCRELELRLPQEALDTPFSLWQDGRPALAEWVKQATVN